MYRKTFTFEGKRYDVTAKTEQELYEKIARKKIELEEGYNKITKNTLVRDWCREWLDTYKAPTVGLSWYKSIEGICNNIIIAEIGNMRIKDVKSVHIQKILNSMSNCSRSYLGKIRVVINEIFLTAKKNGLIKENPAEGALLPQGRKPTARRSLTPSERVYLLRAADKHPKGLFVKIMLYCGLRPGEVAALQWRNIDVNKKILKVDRAVKADGTIGPPKSDAGFRSVPIPDVLITDLKEKEGNPFDLVCTNKYGKMLNANTIRNLWDSIVYHMNIEAGCKTKKKALVPPLRISSDLVRYCLRHTYCTDLQAAGVPINVARELMGHSDISITAKIYTHSSDESFNNAADLINSLNSKRASVGRCVGASE